MAEAAARYRPAALQALREWDLEVRTLELVTVSENVTFRLTDAGGTRWVLRLHRPGYHTLAELEAERVWIRALDAAGIAVPQPLRTRAGAEYATATVAADGGSRHVGISRWQRGKLLGALLEHDRDPARHLAWFHDLGALMAGLHAQAVAWPVPPGFARHAVDADGLLGDAPFWGRFWEHPQLHAAQRRTLLAARHRIHAALARLGRPDGRFSLIHADLHAGNVLVRPPDEGGLAVIDFDDAGFGWHAYDLAVALVGHRQRPHFADLQAALVAGYRTRRDLDAATLALVPLFMLVRNLAQLGWLMQRPELRRPVEVADLDALCARCAALELPV